MEIKMKMETYIDGNLIKHDALFQIDETKIEEPLCSILNKIKNDSSILISAEMNIRKGGKHE